MESTTDTLLTPIETAKFYIIFGLFGKMDMAFVKSILSKVYIEDVGELTEKQKSSLANSVDKLRMRDKLSSYDIRGACCYFNEEIERDSDEELMCCATQNPIGDGDIVIKNGDVYSVEAFMEASKIEAKPKQFRPKIKLNSLIKK